MNKSSIHKERERQREENKPYDPYRKDVIERIREDLKQIRDLADTIREASLKAESLTNFPKVDEWEWEQQMDKIHDARKKIRWIICEKRGRFV